MDFSVALSNDGNTLAVTSISDDSLANGINGDASDNSGTDVGAAYVFRYLGGVWSQQAYLKMDSSESDDSFGNDISISGDGNILRCVRSW
ncbi:hypothetical protein P4S70_21005 [Enterovibrio sp. Hal110]